MSMWLLTCAFELSQYDARSMALLHLIWQDWLPVGAGQSGQSSKAAEYAALLLCRLVQTHPQAAGQVLSSVHAVVSHHAQSGIHFVAC